MENKRCGRNKTMPNLWTGEVGSYRYYRYMTVLFLSGLTPEPCMLPLFFSCLINPCISFFVHMAFFGIWK
jgi:hypothetical protein